MVLISAERVQKHIEVKCTVNKNTDWTNIHQSHVLKYTCNNCAKWMLFPAGGLS